MDYKRTIAFTKQMLHNLSGNAQIFLLSFFVISLGCQSIEVEEERSEQEYETKIDTKVSSDHLENDPVINPKLDERDDVLPQADLMETASLDIKDPARPPDTVLATVEGEEIILQDIYDEFDRMTPQQQIKLYRQQHKILEKLIHQKILIHTALEKGVKNTPLYQRRSAESTAFQDSQEKSLERIEDEVLIEVLLKKEVIRHINVSDEELIMLYEHYESDLPEDSGFSDIRPSLEQLIVSNHVDEYIDSLKETAALEINQTWKREKLQEAGEAPADISPGTQDIP